MMSSRQLKEFCAVKAKRSIRPTFTPKRETLENTGQYSYYLLSRMVVCFLYRTKRAPREEQTGKHHCSAGAIEHGETAPKSKRPDQPSCRMCASGSANVFPPTCEPNFHTVKIDTSAHLQSRLLRSGLGMLIPCWSVLLLSLVGCLCAGVLFREEQCATIRTRTSTKPTKLARGKN